MPIYPGYLSYYGVRYGTKSIRHYVITTWHLISTIRRFNMTLWHHITTLRHDDVAIYHFNMILGHCIRTWRHWMGYYDITTVHHCIMTLHTIVWYNITASRHQIHVPKTMEIILPTWHNSRNSVMSYYNSVMSCYNDYALSKWRIPRTLSPHLNFKRSKAMREYLFK